MKEIQLSQGKVAIVDDEDYECLSQWKWCCHKQGYACRGTGWKKQHKIILMHRVILNPPDNMDIDHINHDKLDNRRCNLRICTHSQNMWNMKTPNTNKSGIKGISWIKEKHRWRAEIKINNKRYHLGYFDNLEDAAKVYEARARELRGEFYYLGEGIQGKPVAGGI